MSSPVNVLAFSGSARSGSWNGKLLAAVVAAATAEGAKVEVVDLRALALPIYDGDLEAGSGVPGMALELRARIAACDRMLIACPEYNGSVSALLKNALDWCSRPTGGAEGLAPFRGKQTAIVAASVSPYGGVRALAHLRLILGKMGAVVLGEEMAVPSCGGAFDEAGALIAAPTANMAKAVGAALAKPV